MRGGDLAAFSASTSGTATPVDDGSADIGAQPAHYCQAWLCSEHVVCVSCAAKAPVTVAGGDFLGRQGYLSRGKVPELVGDAQRMQGLLFALDQALLRN